ncbi:hypothetical protein [Silvimonas iriomotensis]|uniref:Nicotinamidase-related amidase n=1 Tax=Silvimonas iriomotensis TaxID=449662 RepID=A0ABQ2PAI1_9NEIS|nr:hypothetical protein [Silvimonas iriomotensis]GGP22445.1 hypothetical protein GCM10010970_25270 [Silvimonas iriomotensis]
MTVLAKAATQLLLIDPQNDFCDIPGAALPVPGANADMQRVADLLARHAARFDAIHVTLDSHRPIDIAHPAWWRDASGQSPAPFTLITQTEVQQGRWQARDPALQAASLRYVQELTRRGHYQLLVWPEHCLIGSWGHNVHAGLFAALNQWSRQQIRPVHYQIKGLNPGTEHYSAIEAEVPDPADPHTLPDQDWIARLQTADTIVIAGEALSHCVAGTVRDLARQLGDAHVHKLLLLTDCSSAVSGFEEAGNTFVQELVARGMRTATSDTLFA